MRFRFPCLSQASLSALYADLPETVWEVKEEPPYWTTIRQWLFDLKPAARVLDVGCSRGDFLKALSNDYRKFGVEPSLKARTFAEKEGIEIIGSSIDDGITPGRTFEVISLLDVLEHLTSPQEVLNKLCGHLEPNGKIIILTGATDSFPWKLFGRFYWYCSLMEHVSFFSRAWFEKASPIAGLTIGRVRYLSSEPESIPKNFIQFAKLSLFVFVAKCREYGITDSVLRRIPILSRVVNWKHTPWWRASRDHILIELIKR